MKIKQLYRKAEPVLRLGAALYVIGTSIYDIKEDITALRKEHGLLIIGIISLVKTGMEIRKKVSEIRRDTKEI